MKSTLCTILLLLATLGISIEGYSQKEKKVEVFKNKTYKDYVDAIYYYDASNNLDHININLWGQDHGYQQIVKVATIYFGAPKDFMNFIKQVDKFIAENGSDADVSSTIEGRRISTVKVMGMKGFNITEKDGTGYRGYTAKTWGKMREGFVEWAKENKVEIE